MGFIEGVHEFVSDVVEASPRDYYMHVTMKASSSIQLCLAVLEYSRSNWWNISLEVASTQCLMLCSSPVWRIAAPRKEIERFCIIQRAELPDFEEERKHVMARYSSNRERQITAGPILLL